MIVGWEWVVRIVEVPCGCGMGCYVDVDHRAAQGLHSGVLRQLVAVGFGGETQIRHDPGVNV